LLVAGVAGVARVEVELLLGCNELVCLVELFGPPARHEGRIVELVLFVLLHFPE